MRPYDGSGVGYVLLDPSLECRRITEDKSRDAVIWFYSLAGLSADDWGCLRGQVNEAL
jgi:hypothetical protein